MQSFLKMDSKQNCNGVGIGVGIGGRLFIPALSNPDTDTDPEGLMNGYFP